jgi:lysophospholipid acyltransferase (LPLAT)-like uncharacterized protein
MIMARTTTASLRASLEDLKISLIGFLGALLLRTINLTLRWHVVGLDGEARYWPSRTPHILTFWHGHQLFMAWSYLNGVRGPSPRPLIALISHHRDGRMVAKVMSFLGVGSVAGSSSRGGREAIFSLIEQVRGGSHIAITPDGPKGPPYKLKGGVIRIAQRTGAPILPAAIAAERRWTFRSWDEMFLPKPFSRAVLVVGDPIIIPEKFIAGDLEKYSAQVEVALNSLTRRANEFQYSP